MTIPRASPSKVLVLGCGNPIRGDDALGTMLMERVGTGILQHPEWSVEAFEDFQFQVEHSLDLQNRDLVLFVDAAVVGVDPYTFQAIEPTLDPCFSTHTLSPRALLKTFMTLGFGMPPPAFSLGVRGHAFGLGKDLSPQGRLNLEAAWDLLERLLNNPSRSRWEGLCTLTTTVHQS